MTTESSSPKLRPLSMGELLDRIVRLYRQNFLTFIGIVALVQIPVTLIQLLLTISTADTQAGAFMDPTAQHFSQFNTALITSGIVSLAVTVLSFVLVQGVGTAALTQAVANSYLGQKTGILDAYREIGRVWITLLGALIIAVLIGIALLVWFLIPCIGWITGIGILVYYGWVVIPLIAPVIVLEGQSPTDAVRRVWGLVRRRFWWVFGFAFLLLVFNYLLIAGPTAVASFIFQFAIGDPFALSRDQLILQSVVQSIITLIFSLLYLPLQLTGYTLLYFDLRVRLEGFDLAVLASEAVSEEPMSAVETIAAAPRDDSRFVVTWNELGYFAVISIGGAVIYFILIAILGSIFGLMINGF